MIFSFALAGVVKAGGEQSSQLFKGQHAFTLLRNNVTPTRGIYGLQFGGLKPFAGDGHLFEANEDFPHGDYGVVLGFDYWKRNLNALDYHIGLNAKFVQYHFHTIGSGGEELTARFRMLYYSIPFTLHLSIPHYKYLQFLGGISIATFNTLPNTSGTLENYNYSTILDLKWFVSPELILGINFMEEKTDYFFIRGSINYTSFLMRNQSFGVNMTDGTNTLNDSRRMPSSKVVLLITVYPKWKFKRGVSNDQGVNCPQPF